MAIETVGLLSPGDMGHAVGRVLREHGMDVVTCLDGRSERTRALSASAGIRDVPDLDEMVDESDLVLSILVPAEAVGVCESVAAAGRRVGTDVVFADCSATSPQTATRMEVIMREAGGRYVDGSIIGGPPGPGVAPRFYVSGPYAGIMSELDGKGIDVRPLGDAVGRASGIKMCYAAVTKGTSALSIAQLAVAEALGLSRSWQPSCGRARLIPMGEWRRRSRRSHRRPSGGSARWRRSPRPSPASVCRPASTRARPRSTAS